MSHPFVVISYTGARLERKLLFRPLSWLGQGKKVQVLNNWSSIPPEFPYRVV